MNYKYNIFNSNKIEQHFGFDFSYMYFKENKNTHDWSGLDVRIDSLGNVIEKNIVFVEDYNFKRFSDFLIGIKYNLNLDISYNQGLLKIYDAYASASTHNYQTNYSDFFEQTTKGYLSSFKLDFGIGYRFIRKTQNKPKK
jgi:hypothetical protein